MKTTRVYEPCGHCFGRGRCTEVQPAADTTVPLPEHATYSMSICLMCIGTGKGKLRWISEEEELYVMAPLPNP